MSRTPDIPIFRYAIPLRGHVSRPTPERDNGDIYTYLADAPEVLTAGRHSLKVLLATGSHTDRKHDVTFICQTSGRTIGTQPDKSWEVLARDTAFLRSLSGYIMFCQQHFPQLYVYMVMGFHRPGADHGLGTAVLDRGLQSLPLPHIHWVDGWSAQMALDGVLEPSNSRDAMHIASFINTAGEMVTEALGARASSVGSQMIFRQSAGGFGNEDILDRVMFASPDITSALQQTLELVRFAKSVWRRQVDEVARHSIRYRGVSLPVRQLPVPGASFIFLNDRDRLELGLPEARVLVQTFPVIGPPGELMPNGGLIRHTVPAKPVPWGVFLPSLQQ